MFDARSGSGQDNVQGYDPSEYTVKRPTGLTLLSVGAFLMMLGYAIMALVILWMLPALNDPDMIEALVNAGLPQWVIENSRGLALLGLVQSLLYAAAYLYISYGFYYGRELARSLALMLIILIYASSAISFMIYSYAAFNFAYIITLAFGLVINTAILWYITQPETAEFFKDIEQGAALEPTLNL
jgi:hypothetical protein